MKMSKSIRRNKIRKAHRAAVHATWPVVNGKFVNPLRLLLAAEIEKNGSALVVEVSSGEARQIFGAQGVDLSRFRPISVYREETGRTDQIQLV
jgi:hypothetical protein